MECVIYIRNEKSVEFNLNAWVCVYFAYPKKKKKIHEIKWMGQSGPAHAKYQYLQPEPALKWTWAQMLFSI